MTIQEIRNQLERKKGQRTQIRSQLSLLRQEITTNTQALQLHEKAREVLREVGLKTQQELQFHISDITSLALEAVFDNPYELGVEFVQRRNKTECDLFFSRDGNRIDPLEASGVGAVDVAAFALRVASWSMSSPRSRPVIILDEPMRFLSAGYQERASAMIKEISQKLGIQFIIITHEQILTSSADRIFEVSMRKKVSQVKVI